jgi:hypothetical protein
MSNQNVAHTYSPTEPESGVFPAAKPLGRSSHDEKFSIDPAQIDGAARLALFEAICILARAASRCTEVGQ